MPTFELAIVDSISASPTTRLNLNDGITINTLADGTDFGMPDLDRAIVSTLLINGANVPSSAYGNRTVTLYLEFPGSDLDAIATRLQALIRELDRPTNLLRYRPGTSAPVFFQTFRSAPAAVQWDPIMRRASVPILCRPFALGLQESLLSSATITNDPQSGGNAQTVTMTGVKGDVETPAYVTLTGLGASANPATLIIGTRRRGTPGSMQQTRQAESATLGTDTTLPGADAAMSGGGSNYARSSFATNAGMDFRLIMTNFPSNSGTDIRGTYRMYGILRGNGVFNLQWQYVNASISGAVLTGDTVSFAPANSALRYLVDLGQITFPVGNDPVTDGYSGVEKSIAGGRLFLLASRTSGTNLDWDYITLVPDSPALGDDWFSLSLNGGNIDVIVDGPQDMVYVQTAGASTMDVWTPIPTAGRIPHLTPNQSNRWVLLRPDRTAMDATYGDDKSRTYTMSVSYWPRYLTVARPVAS